MTLRDSIILEAKRVEEDSILSSKRHFNDAQFWEKIHYWLGIPSVALAAIAGASSLSKWECGPVTAGILSIIVALLTAINTFLNPAQKSENHQKAGNAYLVLKNKSRVFAEIEILKSADEDDILVKLKELTELRDQLNSTSPQTRKKAFKEAKFGVDNGEAKYQVDKKLENIT